MAITRNITASFSEVESSLNAILPLVTSSMLLCLVSKSSVILEGVLGNLNKGNVTFMISSNAVLSSQCKDIIFVDLSPVDVSKMILAVPNVSWKFKIVIVLPEANRNILDEFEQINTAFKSAEVVISTKVKTYYLSSPLNKDRRLSQIPANQQSPPTRDLGGLSIPAAFVSKEPWIIPRIENNTVKFDGMEVRFFNDLAQHLNFNWLFHLPKSCVNETLFKILQKDWIVPAQFGKKAENGSWWCGVSLALDRGDAEVSFGNVNINKNAGEYDIAPVLSDVNEMLMVRRPKTVRNRWETIYKLFTPAVWAMVLFALLITALVYLIISCFKISLLDSVFTMYGLMLMAGSASPTARTAHLLNCWSIFALLTTTAFTSSIIIRFTLPVYQPRMDTVKQLIENDHYLVQNLQALRSEFSKNFMNKSKWHERVLETTQVMKAADIVRRTSTDDKVMFSAIKIGADTVVPYWAGRQVREEVLAKYRVAREPFDTTFSTFVFRKGSAVFPALSQGVQRLLEAGLWEHHKRSVMLLWGSPAVRRLPEEHDRPDFEDPEELTVFKLKPVFLMLIAGLVIATAAFVGEHARFYWTEGKTFFQARKNVPETVLKLEDHSGASESIDEIMQVQEVNTVGSDLLSQPSTSKINLC